MILAVSLPRLVSRLKRSRWLCSRSGSGERLPRQPSQSLRCRSASASFGKADDFPLASCSSRATCRDGSFTSGSSNKSGYARHAGTTADIARVCLTTLPRRFVSFVILARTMKSISMSPIDAQAATGQVLLSSGSGFDGRFDHAGMRRMTRRSRCSLELISNSTRQSFPARLLAPAGADVRLPWHLCRFPKRADGGGFSPYPRVSQSAQSYTSSSPGLISWSFARPCTRYIARGIAAYTQTRQRLRSMSDGAETAHVVDRSTDGPIPCRG